MHAAARPQNRIGLQTWQSERCTDKESQIISALSCHVVQPHPVCPWGWHPPSAADFSQPANPCPASITEARRASKETKWATDQTMRERSENEKDTQNERQRERERERERERPTKRLRNWLRDSDSQDRRQRQHMCKTMNGGHFHRGREKNCDDDTVEKRGHRCVGHPACSEEQ